MEYKSLGHLPNAPLVYTVGMIEYAHIPAIAEYAPLVQEELRQDFPEINNFSVNSVQINLNTKEGRQEFSQREIPHWGMNTADRAWGVVFGEQRLILQTCQYKHFKEFAEKFRKVVDILVQKAKVTHTSNVGIRYVDNIKVVDGLGIHLQLKDGFLSPELTTEFKPELSRVEHIYKSNDGQLFLRCYGLLDKSGIPDDIHPMANQLFRDKSSIAPIIERFALLDTDHIYVPNQLEPLDVDTIIDRLDRLHKGASVAFRSAITKDALDAWKKGV